MYRPLPESILVKESPVHGYWLFATINIPYGTDLGVSHIFAVGFKNNYIRTPLGGFINHSDTPNCFKVKSHDDSSLTYYLLQTIKDIKKGEELTVTYTLVKKLFKVAKMASCPEVDDNTLRDELDTWKQNDWTFPLEIQHTHYYYMGNRRTLGPIAWVLTWGHKLRHQVGNFTQSSDTLGWPLGDPWYTWGISVFK